MKPQPTSISIKDQVLLLDPHGSVYHPKQRWLAVSDMHLDKGRAAAKLGSLLPPWDIMETLNKLASLVDSYQPSQLILLGDSFHRQSGILELSSQELTFLEQLVSFQKTYWILGNHDSTFDKIQPNAVSHYMVEPFLFQHQASNEWNGDPEIEISGHYHPKHTITTKGGKVQRPCFVVGENRLILPAFGAYTGGLSVENKAIKQFFPQGCQTYLLGKDKLYNFPIIPSNPPNASDKP